MIAFAVIGPDGLPTGGGIRPVLPDGAIPLAEPFTTADLPRLRWTGSEWVVRQDIAPAPNPLAILESHRAAALKRIRAEVDRARSGRRTAIAGQDEVYRDKRAEALAYLRQAEIAGEPEGLEDFPLIAAELGLTAETPWQMAQLWLHLSDADRAHLHASEAARKTAEAALAIAPDIAAIEAILDQLMTRLRGLVE